jgi:hypothetical protein
MRATIAIVLGFLILIAISGYSVFQIEKTSQNLQLQLEAAENSITAGQWDEASAQIKTSFDNWTQARNWWAIILNHSTLEGIEVSYTRLEQYTLHREITFSLTELKTLKILLENIPESESLKLHNIL